MSIITTNEIEETLLNPKETSKIIHYIPILSNWRDGIVVDGDGVGELQLFDEVQGEGSGAIRGPIHFLKD